VKFIISQNLKKLNIIVIVFLILTAQLSGRNYYVKSLGNDGNTGLSDTQAWKTLSKVNSFTFSPGDSIFLKKGDTWREQLTINQSGSVGSYITYTSYGTGAKPKILGSTKAITWIPTGTANVWQSETSLTNPYSETKGTIFFIGIDATVTFGVPKTYSLGFANLTTEYDWTWNANTLYLYSTSDPDIRYSSIEAAQREQAVLLNSKEFIEINGIDMFFTMKSGVHSEYPTKGLSGYTLKNCEIAYLGYINNYGYGSHVCYNTMLIEYNTIHDCGRRGVSIVNYGTHNISNIIVQNNTFYNGYHTTGVDIETGVNSGESGNISNLFVRSNVIYDPETRNYSTMSNFIQGPQSGTGIITDFHFYDNIIKYSSTAGLQIEQVTGPSFIYNNTFYGFNKAMTSYIFLLYVTQGSRNITVKNNIFYNDANYDINSGGLCVFTASNTSYSDIVSDYNLYFATDSRSRIVRIGGSPDKDFHMSDLAAMTTTLGWDSHSPTPADPSFVSTADYHLKSGSPAINSGVNVDLQTDFDGKSWAPSPSIGAYEFSSILKVPAIPVYQSSVVENASPDIIEMNYNLSLTNITPSTSAFNVQVNTISRSINSVSISGTKVLLTLSSPVVYGDVIKVAYNKPATNPLQTAAGGQAATISAQSVTNNLVQPVSPVYVSSTIENATPSLLQLTFNMSLANILPAASAFVVQVNNVPRAVNSVAISGTMVLLTLSSPVVYADVIKVAYNKPATNPLQTAAGGQAATISAQSVTNNLVQPVSPVYVSSAIENATPSLLQLIFNMSLANILPAASAFVVQVNNVPRTVNSVAISGTMVLLTLSSPIVYGDIIKIAYNKPATNPLQTAAGGQAASISAQSVTNNLGLPVSPVYVGSTIENASPSLLKLTFNMNLANILPAASAFVVQVNTVPRTVNSVAISGTMVLLTLSSPAVYGDIIKVAYNKPAANPLQTAAGGQAASISAQSVTNNLGLPVSPVYVSSSIENATPSLLQLNFNMSLANILPAASAFVVQVNNVPRAVNSIAISGTMVLLTLSNPVVYGDVIKVAYSKPAINPLQTAAGEQAATINAQSVINNCLASANQPPIVSISSPNKNSSFIAPATITVDAVASDPDGFINKVEFFNGSTKLGGGTAIPYSFTMKDLAAGTYSLTAVATDNLNSKTTSAVVIFTVTSSIPTSNKLPVIKITNPGRGNKFTAHSSVNIAVDAYDPDGTISKVEYFNGTAKIGESVTPPFSFSFETANAGTYDITAIAYDNLNATASSEMVNINVIIYDGNSELINLYPNPNNGQFSIDILTTLEDEKNTITIVNVAGETVYSSILSKEETTRQLDISHLYAGIYILSITGKNIIITKKIIKK
jgi:uncharacterized repeat protein (TIGR02059 family)